VLSASWLVKPMLFVNNFGGRSVKALFSTCATARSTKPLFVKVSGGPINKTCLFKDVVFPIYEANAVLLLMWADIVKPILC